jgi:nucleotide-binding universal stress UspA family protein
MAYAAIMVSVESDAASDRRLAVAHRLAARFEATLIGLAAEAPRAMLALASGTAAENEAEGQEHRRVTAALQAAERRFHAALRPEDAARAEWRAFAENPARALVREARSADLLVIGTGGRLDSGDVLLTAGRPVLVVPAAVNTLQARHIVIGWRDTPQSRRAVTDALPLLRRAESVRVLAVAKPDDAAAAGGAGSARAGTEAVVAHLARHGVAAASGLRQSPHASVPEALIAAAAEHDADLIVAGAYGHARALEWKFGGVTRALLGQAPVCCLLSH